ncbi:polysaccharide deacetylase family protein [Stutzerimonas zhaodongensis]|uniref:polysaccharide deacetylase family protein n=2 Tax=Stutzerimonas zhaodongensis TaxID=1176257 RepID=UPI00142E1024|nr:polysaccharide deacetylase family protein [Stutzerimonas zhaodongensis]MCQ4317840.1 polysaccharide deacetylase family protein [Stutzerimonas zhaodongensis]
MPFWDKPAFAARVIAAVFIVSLLIAAATAFIDRNTFDRLDKLNGPGEPSYVSEQARSDWKGYSGGERSRLAILLTDEDSAWLGLAHGLKSIGVPFTITDDVTEATRHHVVLVYPLISGRTLDEAGRMALRRHVEKGRTLIATQVLGGGVQDLFGFESTVESRSHHSIIFEDVPTLEWISDPNERTVLLGQPELSTSWTGTQTYEKAQQILARFEDGSAAMVKGDNEAGGSAYALGFDLGFFIMRAHNDRNDQGYRAYANGYEPSVDVWLRWLKAVYREHEPLAITMASVPEGRQLAAVVTFDVDYVESMGNLLAYRDLLVREGVPATFFLQTKYYRDFQDEGFFNDRTLAALDALVEAGMEIASHSVSHSDMYASVPLGDGTEQYPLYQPRVKSLGDTRGATVLGELRVSRFLLEQLTGGQVVSFRPGYLATPPRLPEALAASGYRFSSSATAGNLTTHLPFRTNAQRMYSSETSVFEFPIAVEDEIPPIMDQRVEEAVELAEKLARYGASFVMLLHPNEVDHKYRFLEQILPRLKPIAWFGTLKQYGSWWAARDKVELDVQQQDGGVELKVKAPEPIKGLAFELPEDLRPYPDSVMQRLPDGRWLINEVPAGTMTISLGK